MIVSGWFATVYLSERSKDKFYHGRFLLGLTSALTVVCFIVPAMLGGSNDWRRFGPSILFSGLLTVVNAPFDWFSLGVTRYLLRTGLSGAQWRPFVYAAVDLLVAAATVVALAIICTVAVQAFDILAWHAGGTQAMILWPEQFLAELRADPGAFQFWWAYSMLFSTLIPSVVNVSVAGAAVCRGLPWVTPWLLSCLLPDTMPKGFDRMGLAWALAGQLLLGGLVFVVWELWFVWGLLIGWFAAYRYGLLDIVQAVAEYDLPAKLLLTLLGH